MLADGRNTVCSMGYSGHAKYQKREQRIQKEPSLAGSREWMVVRNTRDLQKAGAFSREEDGKSNMWKIKVPGEGWENNLSRAGELRNSLTSTPSAKNLVTDE